MHEGEIKKLAQVLFSKKKDGEKPLLLLGAGISIDSGSFLNNDLMEGIVRDYHGDNKIRELKDKANGEEDNESLAGEYQKIIKQRSISELYGVFAPYLQHHRPSFGYDYFAKLLHKGYFDWIITTNFDPLVEEALSINNFPMSNFILYIRDFTAPDVIADHINRNFSNPAIKLLKLHGDVNSRVFDATEDDIKTFSEEEKKHLVPALVNMLRQRDLIVIGHQLGDENINDLLKDAEFSKNKNSIWWHKHKRPGKPNKIPAIFYELEDYSKFCKEEFQNKFTIESLCKAITEDDYGLTLKAIIDTLEWLNELLTVPNFYKKVYPKKSGFKFSESISKLAEKTNGYNNNLTNHEKKNIRDLNRLLLEELYPKETPKSQLIKKGISDKNKCIVEDGFDNLMQKLYENIRELELKENKPPYRLADFEHIYYTAGMTVNKKQLIEKVVAPSHVSQNGDITDVSPIFFASLSDMKIVNNFVKNLERNRYIGKVYPIFSDHPQIELQYVDCIKVAIKNNLIKFEEYNKMRTTKKGIQGLSAFLLYCNKTTGSKIKISIDNGNDILPLRSIVLLAGHKDVIEYVNDMGTADLSLSIAGKSDCDSNFEIASEFPMKRFIPFIDKNSFLSTTFKEAFLDDRLFFTVGGPEHNKMLELFIALHRFSGGTTIFNESNAFDMEEYERKQFTALKLNTETYVGGAVQKKGQTVKSERGELGAYIAAFTFDISKVVDIYSLDIENIAKRKVYVKAVVGMSAMASMLAVHYLSTAQNYTFRFNTINIIPLEANINNITPEHFKDLTNKDNDREILCSFFKLFIPEDIAIFMNQPVRDEHFKMLNELSRIDGDSYEIKVSRTYNDIFAKIIDSYFIRNY